MSLLLFYIYFNIFPLDLLRPRDTYQFSVEHGELKVYKTLDTPLFSTGELAMGREPRFQVRAVPWKRRGGKQVQGELCLK